MKTMMKKLLLLLVFLPCSIFAQATLSGVVSDATGPLPGVNVKVLGTSNGAATDFNGAYALKNLKKGDKIEFSFIGYKETIVVFNGQKTQNVTLAEDSKVLEEVVVQVGYGSVKKKDATGAVTTISAKDFNKGPAVSADQLLVGKAPGVRITSEGGQPDANPNIRIRGGASLSSNNNPLIIIDGVPIDGSNPAGVSNPLTLVNPNDVESFTVLKDASATAIYGSRASNGVIIIVTKKGTKGAPQFNFASSVTVGQVSKRLNVMNGDQFAAFIEKNHPTLTDKLGVANGVIDPKTGVQQLDDKSTVGVIEGRTLSNTDWQDLIYRTSFTTDNSFSARANLFDKVPFRASVGYSKVEGVVRTSNLARLTGSVKLSPSFFDNHLKVDVNAKGISSEKNAIDDGGALGSAANMDPTRPVYEGSNYAQPLNANGSIDGSTNPVAILNQRKRPEEVKKILANIELDYKFHFFKDLRAIANFGVEASKSKIREEFSAGALQTYRLNNTSIPKTDPATPATAANYIYNPGINATEDQSIFNKTMDTYLAYNKTLKGFVTRVDAQAGYSYQNFVNDGSKGLYIYNASTGLREAYVKNPLLPNNEYYNERNLQSFFGRSNFDLVDKYLFTFTLRADGSSFFVKEKRWGYFPAAGFSWRAKDEAFLKNIKAISDLKLRLSWGLTGQQDVSSAGGSFYPYTPLFTPVSAQSSYFPGVNSYAALPYDKSLTWEKTSTYNVGVDFDVLKNNLLSGSIDVYQRYTKDLLSEVTTYTGQFLKNVFPANIGVMESKGAELNLNLKPIANDDFSLTLNGNISYNISKITDLGNRQSNDSKDGGIPNGTGTNLAYNVVGEQPHSAWVFEQVYDANSKPIQGSFVDRNNDGVISNEDRKYVALRPNWTYGMGFTVIYKKFDLVSSFRGQLGGKVYNGGKLKSSWLNKPIPTNSNSLSNVLNNDFDFVTINGNIPFSDYYLENASFLRCQNVSLGYMFDKLAKGLSMKVNISASNLFLITNYSGQDPENFNAIDNNFYPRPRTYSVGVNLDF